MGLYGGFAATETLRSQRDWVANLTILSGDLDGNDITDPNGMVTDSVSIVGDNAYHVLTVASVDATTEGYEGESPTHEAGVRLAGDLPRGIELDVLTRLVGRLESHDIGSYATADLRLSVPVGRGARLVLVGQNLLQAEHREIDSNTSGTVHAAVQRGAYAALEWDL